MKNQLIPLYPIPEVYAENSRDCIIIDERGKEYIDFESGVWCTNLGYCNKRINHVIKNQIEKNIHHGYKFNNRFADELSKTLQNLFGFKNGQSVFLSSGSEAVNLAVMISQIYTGRDQILSLDNSYLSAYGFGLISDENKNRINIPFNDIKAISKIDFSKVAAFILETGGASVNMVQIPDYDFIQELVKAAHKNGCLVIANEVTTGVGRMGKWFGYMHYNVNPDLVATGKALGNGYPVSAVTINSKIAEFLASSSVRYAQSHQNDPLGCAIGLEVIKIIEEENIIEHSYKSGEYFKEQLQKLKTEYPDKVKNVRGRGLMLAIEFQEQVDANKINSYLFENGFIVGCKLNSLRFLPPLIIKKENIDELISSVKFALVHEIK